jgi:tyrosine-protein phosphatase YwqE
LFDVHTHLLPNVDDGAQSDDEAVAILDGLAALGFVKVAATPHFRCLGPPRSGYRLQPARVERIQEMRDHRLPEVVCGAEVVLDEHFVQAEAEGLVPAIGADPSYLVEFGFGPSSVPLGVENVIFRFQVKGKFLILAHPERTPDFQANIERLARLRNSGAIVQVDLMSLVGANGTRSQKAVYRMLEEGMVDVMATDIHAPDDLPVLAEALRSLLDWNPREFTRLLSRNPRLILEGKAGEVTRYE